ncbi:hypothetical protein Tco_0590881 [Tanacetum coccineum]
MTTLADKAILSGAENLPPMLENDMYDSWKSIMELYMMNRQHGRMILESVENAIQADCDVKETNIILQGLPPEVYALVSNHKVAKELWERIQLLMQGTSLTKQEREFSTTQLINHQSSTPLSITYPSNDYESSVHHNIYSPSSSIPQLEYPLSVDQQSEFSQQESDLIILVFQKGDDHIDAINHMMSFFTAVVTSRYPTTNNQLRNSSNPRQQVTINNGRVTLQPIQGRQTSIAAGEGHMSKQCNKPNRKRDDSWFKDKVLLVQAQASGQILHEEELTFLADPRILEGQAIQTVITHNVVYQANDLDAYDSDCDELNTAKVSLMENLSHYGSNALSEVHNHDNVNNDMTNQVMQAMSSSEQSNIVNHSETEITSDSNIIPYSYVNDTLTAELERYKEQVKVLKEGQNVDLKSQDNVSESCAQSVEIDHLKRTLSEHLKEKESLLQTVTLLKNDFKKEESRNLDREIALEKHIKHLDNIVFKRDQSAQTVKRDQSAQTKAQQLEPMLYVGDIIQKTNPIVIPDSEETLTLAEESRSKMLLKHKDNMMQEKIKQIDTTPIDYAALNKLYKDFETRFVPQTELSNEQALWSHNSVNFSELDLSDRPTNVEVPKELPKVSMVNTSLKKLKYHLANFNVVVKERTTPTAITEGTWGFKHIKACFTNEIIPFVKTLKDLFSTFNQQLVDELAKVQNVFYQMEQAIEEHRRNVIIDLFGIEIPVRGINKARDTVMSDFEDFTVTYTAVSNPFGGLSDIRSPGVDGPPMMPEDPYVYVAAAFQASPSPDYVSGPEYPPSPDFVPEPVYPEFMPPEDEVLPAEEQPLLAAVSPTADSPGYVPESDPEEDPYEDDDEDPEEDPDDYPAGGGDDGDDEDESSDDDEDDDVDIEGEEEHPAPADSTAIALPAVDQASSAEETESFKTEESAATPPPHPAYRVNVRILIRDEPFWSNTEVARLLAIPTPPPSPLYPWSSPLPQIPSPPLPPILSPLPVSPPPPASPTYLLGYRAVMIRLRAEAPSTSHSPPPHIILSYTIADTPPSGTPPSGTPPLLPKPLLTSSPPLHLLSTNRRVDRPEVILPPRKRLGIALGLRYEDLERDVGYGITDTYDDMSVDMPGAPATDDTELGRRMTEFTTRVRQDTDEIYTRLDDEQTERQLMAGRLNMLYRDRRAHARTTLLMEREARMSREAWGRSMDASDLARSEVMSLRTTVLGQQAVITELQAADRRRQAAITELLAADRRRQAQFIEALKLLKGLQTQMTEFQRQQGPAKGPAQPDAPEEAGSSS